MNKAIDSQDKPLAENIKNPEKPKGTIPKPPRKITKKYLHNSGLAYLQRFTSSTENFRAVMERKIKKSVKYHDMPTMDECHDMLNDTIDNFTRMGLLNDDAYLKGMIISLRRRGLSKNMILQKLQQKRLPQTCIIDAIKDHDDCHQTIEDSDYIASIRFMRRKRLGPFRTKQDFDFNKELSALARAGFSFDVAQKALKTDIESAQELLRD